MSDPRQLSIQGIIRDHSDAIQTVQLLRGILTLLEDFLQAKPLCLSNLIIEANSAIVIAWLSNRERGSLKFDNWIHKIIDASFEVGCFFS